jgi:hypothetical protein
MTLSRECANGERSPSASRGEAKVLTFSHSDLGLGRYCRITRYSETGRIRALRHPSSNRIQVVDEMPADGDPAVFLQPRGFRSDRRGLPQSEGVVVKDNNDPSGGAWYKVKQSALAGL